MRIAIDYDGTYTADPPLWNEWIAQASGRGHEVVCVTMRYPHEQVQMPCEVIYTSRQAKALFMAGLNRCPAVWIDDSPHWIFESSN